jgi:hypothetical protein
MAHFLPLQNFRAYNWHKSNFEEMYSRLFKLKPMSFSKGQWKIIALIGKIH